MLKHVAAHHGMRFSLIRLFPLSMNSRSDVAAWKEKKKLTPAVCVQVWILGSGEGVCRGAKL